MSQFSDQVNESSTCCCVDIGTVISNDDCAVSLKEIFDSEQKAQNREQKLIQLARQIESDPCEIQSSIKKMDNGFELFFHGNFCCGAEQAIFLLRLR